ncbi:hypothetical protein [Agromyces bauzanensis]|uniref:Uncharacterized protein n=1 Tax=Agromyces bauzanensis TaxID=1308924 RepID=A0A917PBB1_9MICO|nr:hypothetical protein [Agromyces bauzanensis]GGJ69454.1 hypothetical protein GCM10011372_04070 [Agromyces bauzanensis]
MGARPVEASAQGGTPAGGRVDLAQSRALRELPAEVPETTRLPRFQRRDGPLGHERIGKPRGEAIVKVRC